MPAVMAFVQLFSNQFLEKQNLSNGENTAATSTDASSPVKSSSSLPHSVATDVSMDAFRLMELSDRLSSVIKSSHTDILRSVDPLLSIFRTFGELNGIRVETALAVVMYEESARSVKEHAEFKRAQLVLIPWCPAHLLPETTELAGTGGLESQDFEPSTAKPAHHNPFAGFFSTARPTGGTLLDMSASAQHSQFVRNVYAECVNTTHVALYLDRHAQSGPESSFSGSAHRWHQHIFLPFLGGPDDRLALEFVVQLCANPSVTATVVKVVRSTAFDSAAQRSSLEKPPIADHDDRVDRDANRNESTIASVSLLVLKPFCALFADTQDILYYSLKCDHIDTHAARNARQCPLGALHLSIHLRYLIRLHAFTDRILRIAHSHTLAHYRRTRLTRVRSCSRAEAADNCCAWALKTSYRREQRARAQEAAARRGVWKHNVLGGTEDGWGRRIGAYACGLQGQLCCYAGCECPCGLGHNGQWEMSNLRRKANMSQARHFLVHSSVIQNRFRKGCKRRHATALRSPPSRARCSELSFVFRIKQSNLRILSQSNASTV